MRFLKFLPALFLALYIMVVYRPFIFEGRLPIPADTIVGLYYPWRDAFSREYPNGVPFKNSLITDAVRQEYPWRQLAIEQMRQGKWPLWNPYSFSGYPLAANMQSAPFYPLNIIYLIDNFPFAWSLQVFLQTLLGGIFMVLFLLNLKLSREGATLGMIAWIGSGFFISWLETNMVVQSVIWLPLLLYCVDKLNSPGKKLWLVLVFAFGIVSTILAGHMQTEFYVFLTAGAYTLYRFFENKNLRGLIYPGISVILALLLVTPVLVLAFQFIQLSAREIDQAVWNKPDWFLPWQNLVQFVAPDFFGNPATLNYFGIWNYAEFVGYVGLVALFFGLLGIFSREKDVRVFQLSFFIGLLLILPTPIAKIPYQFNWPFISSSQPSRLISIVSFALSVLAAFGLARWQRENNKRRLLKVAAVLFLVFCLLWLVAFQRHLTVSIRNLVLPTILFLSVSTATTLTTFLPKLKKTVVIALLLLACLDSAMFAGKFLPFSSLDWLFPKTQILTFLTEKGKTEIFRVASTDDTVLPDNYSLPYKIQTASGYDPLYLLRYAELAAAIDRDRPDINPPFNYNRFITPRSIEKRLYPLLNVKYLLSPLELYNQNLSKVMQEGNTRLYEITNVTSRTFFVEKTIGTESKIQTITAMFAPDFEPARTATVEGGDAIPSTWSVGKANIVSYEPNEVIIETTNGKSGFLVITDAYYPTWKAAIDGFPAKIYLADYAFRGLIIPAGSHRVRFYL